MDITERLRELDKSGYQPLTGAIGEEAAAEIERLRKAVATAYGYLWHVNTEPGTPNRYSAEGASYQARKALHALMTNEQRGEGITLARELMRPNEKVSDLPPTTD